jgi:glucosamine--fructose-6-phosphate aminotransferase (isomerizing)
MCGIIGIVGNSAVSDRLVDGLKRMEYRGYDSAGVCTVFDGQLIRRRAEGKLANLVNVLRTDDAPGNIGIAHTRWATHGAPTTSNAHPHATGEVALVHNGIIENFKQLRDELTAFAREKLSGIKIPRRIDFRDELPRHDTGKLYKRLLRDEYWAKQDKPTN